MARGTQTWSRKKLLKFSFLTILVCLLAAEIVARIFFYWKFHELGTSVYVQGSPLQEEDSLAVYNNRACYVDFEKRFQYNEKGMKSLCGDYRMPRKKGGDYWVLLLGASAMEGMGSNKDGAWFDITNIPDHPYTSTIACYLQRLLQDGYPGRKVRVFNAAVSGYTLQQVMAKYRQLSKDYDFDWVISMDGVNECDTMETSGGVKEEMAYSRAYWESFPFHRWPLNWILPITRHSAFFGLLKQELYYLRLNARMQKNESKGFPQRVFWGKQLTGPPLYAAAPEEMRVRRATSAFMKEEQEFAGELEKGSTKYLLLVQPYLVFRDSVRLASEELALDHYLRQEKNDPYRHSFLQQVYDSVGVRSEAGDLHIQDMSGVHGWPGWVFVDYCHFTEAANEKIASELAKFIQTDGKIRIFK